MQEKTQVGQYILVRKLGAGGMGEVWLARHRYLNTIVAIKSLLPEFAHNESLQERFLSEAKRQSELQHPNIVPVLDFFEIDSRSYFVMQYVEGQSLDDRLHESNPPLSLEEIHSISWDVLSALDHAHSHGIVHRDVKPANILLDHSGRALLMDFGIARALRDESRKTLTGVSMGTPDYMSPEQVLGSSAIDARSDVYSFGCVLYAMLCGQPPFGSGPTPVFIVQEQHVHRAPPPPVFRTSEVPPEVSAVVLQCLEKDPGSRYQSCGALMVALDSSLTGGRHLQESISPPVPVGGPAGNVSLPVTPVSIGPAIASTAKTAAMTEANSAGIRSTFPSASSVATTPPPATTASSPGMAAAAAASKTFVTSTPAAQNLAQEPAATMRGAPRSHAWISVVAAAAAIAVAAAVAWWQFNPAHARIRRLENRNWSLATYDDSDFSDCMSVGGCDSAKAHAAQLLAMKPADWQSIPYNSSLLGNCMSYQPCLSRLAHARQLAAVTDWKSADPHLLADCMGYPACEAAKTIARKSTSAAGGDEGWPDCCSRSSNPAACKAWKNREEIPDCSSPIDHP
jgi:serine/threonine protein kinase